MYAWEGNDEVSVNIQKEDTVEDANILRFAKGSHVNGQNTM